MDCDHDNYHVQQARESGNEAELYAALWHEVDKCSQVRFGTGPSGNRYTTYHALLYALAHKHDRALGKYRPQFEDLHLDLLGKRKATEADCAGRNAPRENAAKRARRHYAS